MTTSGTVVREGRWLYDNAVECAVRVLASDVRWGTHADDHDPDMRDDTPGQCFYVEWKKGWEANSRFEGLTGPFETQGEAEAYAEQAHGSHSPIRWL